MAEYDAFGRKIEGSDAEQPNPVPETATAPDVESVVSAGAEEMPDAETAPAPLRLSGVSGGTGFSGRGPVAMIVVVSILITVVGALVAGAFTAFNSSDVEKRIRGALPTIPAVFPEDTETEPAAAPEPEAPAKPLAPPVGLAPRSLIREAAFAEAVARLRRSGIGNLTNLRVAADRIDAQLKTAKGELASVQVRYDGEFRRFSTSGPGFDHVATFPFSAIEKGAPQRMAREASGRRGVSVKRVDYLVMSQFGDEVIWNLFFKDSVHFQGDRSGHVVRRV